MQGADVAGSQTSIRNEVEASEYQGPGHGWKKEGVTMTGFEQARELPLLLYLKYHSVFSVRSKSEGRRSGSWGWGEGEQVIGTMESKCDLDGERREERQHSWKELKEVNRF